MYFPGFPVTFWFHHLRHFVYCVIFGVISGRRLFHVDDIPSGVGGDALDFNKATAVSWILAIRIAYIK